MASLPTSPPPIPHEACSNCDTPLHGKYCCACGQPVEGLVRHFGSVIGDVMDSVLNIDARIVHTLLPLYFRPGKLTQDYFAGKRARYVTPFRLVFFLAIIAFLAIQLLLRTGPSDFVLYKSSPDAGTSSRASVAAAQDSHFANGNITFNDKVVWNRETMPWHTGGLPAFVNDWFNDSVENARNNLHHLNSGNAVEQKTTAQHLMGGLLAVAPQVLFVLLPVFALMLKLFYIFKRRLYMEHLIVAMHSHAFIMLSLLVLVALGLLHGVAAHVPLLGGLLGLLRAAAWIWMLAYLLIMQKRVYRQGWWMTSLKFGVIGIFYSVLISVGTAFALLVTLGSA